MNVINTITGTDVVLNKHFHIASTISLDEIKRYSDKKKCREKFKRYSDRHKTSKRTNLH